MTMRKEQNLQWAILGIVVTGLLTLVIVSVKTTAQNERNVTALTWNQADVCKDQDLLKRALSRDRIVELPEDGEGYHVSICLHDDWQKRSRERRLLAWFETESTLRALKSQVHWHVYTGSNAIYRTRLAHAVGDVLPAVIVQKADGFVAWKRSGENLPDSGPELTELIGRSFPSRPYYLFRW